MAQKLEPNRAFSENYVEERNDLYILLMNLYQFYKKSETEYDMKDDIVV